MHFDCGLWLAAGPERQLCNKEAPPSPFGAEWGKDETRQKGHTQQCISIRMGFSQCGEAPAVCRQLWQLWRRRAVDGCRKASTGQWAPVLGCGSEWEVATGAQHLAPTIQVPAWNARPPNFLHLQPFREPLSCPQRSPRCRSLPARPPEGVRHACCTHLVLSQRMGWEPGSGSGSGMASAGVMVAANWRSAWASRRPSRREGSSSDSREGQRWATRFVPAGAASAALRGCRASVLVLVQETAHSSGNNCAAYSQLRDFPRVRICCGAWLARP